MEITGFPNDQTNEYSKLKRTLALAVTATKGHVLKTVWLNAVLDTAKVSSAARTPLEVNEWTQDGNSESFINLKRELSNALGRNSFKLSGDATLLTAIIAAAETELNA